MSQLVLGLHPCSPRPGFKVGCGLATLLKEKIIKQENQNYILQPPTKQYAFGNPSLGFPGERGFWLLLALVKVAIKRYGTAPRKAIAHSTPVKKQQGSLASPQSKVAKHSYAKKLAPAKGSRKKTRHSSPQSYILLETC